MRQSFKTVAIASILLIFFVISYLKNPYRASNLDIIVTVVPKNGNSENMKELLQGILDDFKDYFQSVLKGKIKHEYNIIFYGLSVELNNDALLQAKLSDVVNKDVDTEDFDTVKEGLTEILTNLRKKDIRKNEIIIDVSEDLDVSTST
ncbi:uncharacterized protein PRCAT00005118001 [Priceomyces carsonii]|uniref:uncharacterized protein n=1 Tax=Priceomyces carsonii TaxID=28549 RepID=UPI002EDAF691|nr:unnamed protein product [Priceomyces carsonii]